MAENANKQKQPTLAKLNTLDLRTNAGGDVLEVPSIAIIAASPVQSDPSHHFDNFDSIGRVINPARDADEEEIARTTKMKARILDNIFTQLSEPTTKLNSVAVSPKTNPSSSRNAQTTSPIPSDDPSTAPTTNSFFGTSFINPISTISSTLNQLIPKSIPTISLPTLPSLPSFSSLLSSNRPREADTFVVGSAPGTGVGEVGAPNSPSSLRSGATLIEGMVRGKANETNLDMDLNIEDGQSFSLFFLALRIADK